MSASAITLKELHVQVSRDIKQLSINDKAGELEALKNQSQNAGFWKDNQSASRSMQLIGSLSEIVEPWLNLEKEINELLNIAELNDASLTNEIEVQHEQLALRYEALKKQLRFNGQYDDHATILSIHAGAGGTDAQDWAQMLLRMYVRWAESNSCKVEMLDESSGDQAGIKSASLEISGHHAYGKLKGEHGVHRLVRLSPFNADNLRQTSFAKVEVLPKIDAPDDIPLDESELKIDVYRAGGHGGQSVNTTDSAVRITHIPTGITVSIQNERSQLQNKETALTIVRSKLAQLKEEQHLESMSEIKGPNQSAEWGSQIRSYVLHPYTMVKDLRTRHETSQADAVLNGDLNPFIEAYLEQNL